MTVTDLNTGDSGTMRERPRAARGMRGKRAASCHQRQWRPRDIISTEPTHLAEYYYYYDVT